ncbi:hypothetical protein BS47DRAFT_125964 [Hydnum rufescens UP504]|uniref:Uncharacterized protein n=1 Tax=Hydnum rufescens UP504 TaxID=1448309 RepID=A0A9P6B7C0_9AGAM|nr:hypothetical protein BS47DRAFT_125964 [Hydnum rufescens UP504]
MCMISIRQLFSSIQHPRFERSGRAISSIHFATEGILTPVPRTEDCYDSGRWASDMVSPEPRPGVQYRDSHLVILSTATCPDLFQATISSSEAQLLRGLCLEMKAGVLFPVDGPTAGDLRQILNILSQESPKYHLLGENCN